MRVLGRYVTVANSRWQPHSALRNINTGIPSPIFSAGLPTSRSQWPQSITPVSFPNGTHLSSILRRGSEQDERTDSLRKEGLSPVVLSCSSNFWSSDGGLWRSVDFSAPQCPVVIFHHSMSAFVPLGSWSGLFDETEVLVMGLDQLLFAVVQGFSLF